MQGLTDIGNFFSSGAGQGIVKGAELGATGAGLIGDIASQRAQSQQQSYLTNAEKTLAGLTPSQITQEAAGASLPLTSALTQEVGNNVDASLAEQGLSEAPGIQSTVLAQALAPYVQQNQEQALQVVMQKLGLPLQYASTVASLIPQGSSLTPLLALLSRGQTPSTSQATQFSGGPLDLMNLIFGSGGASNPAPDFSLGDFGTDSGGTSS